MARPAKALPTPADDGFNPERLEEAGEAAKQLAVIQSQQEATVRAVAAQLGYQLPADCTDPDLIQRDIAANMRRSPSRPSRRSKGSICRYTCRASSSLCSLTIRLYNLTHMAGATLASTHTQALAPMTKLS